MRFVKPPTGQIGLTLYREAPADLVITDILMPERDGMEVTLALTQEFLDARVIAMTGATGDQNFSQRCQSYPVPDV